MIRKKQSLLYFIKLISKLYSFMQQIFLTAFYVQSTLSALLLLWFIIIAFIITQIVSGLAKLRMKSEGDTQRNCVLSNLIITIFFL